MFRGVDRTVLEQRSVFTLQVVGVVAPVFVTLFGLTIVYGIFPSTSFSSMEVFIAIAVLWNLFGIYQIVTPIRNRRVMITHIAIYHLFAVLFLLFVSGFSAPFIGLLALLYLASYIYVGVGGALISAAIALAVVIVNVYMHPVSMSEFIIILASYVATLIVGGAAIALNRIKEDAEIQVIQREALQTGRILTLINNLGDAVVSVDQDGVIQVYNAAALSLFDTNTPLKDTSIDEVLHVVDENNNTVKLAPLFRKAKGVTINDKLVMPTQDEHLRLEIMYAPIRGSSDTPEDTDTAAVGGYVVIIRDVTKAKSLEEERDEFISVVSHELRTPIAIAEGALGNAQLLFERQTKDPKVIAATLDTAHDQVVFLAKMVNDLSTLSRAERGVADTPEVIDVDELAHNLYTEYHAEAEKKGLRFDLELGSKLGNTKASRLYLHELLQNFITNAIKYTKEGSVTLNISRKGDDITFAVRDTGIGISKTEQEKVFLKFYRSEDYRTRETSGTGLGLYVARKLSRKLDTQINLKSRLNHGSTFSFTLPADK